MSAIHRQFLLGHSFLHIYAVRDTLTVRQYDRRTGIGFRLAHGQEGLLWVGTHGYLRHIHIAVGNSL